VSLLLCDFFISPFVYLQKCFFPGECTGRFRAFSVMMLGTFECGWPMDFVINCFVCLT
jgi:hypothetical protein